MPARWLSLRSLLIACLTFDAGILIGWWVLDEGWFSQPFRGRETSFLAASFVLTSLLAVVLSILIVRRRAALAAGTEDKFRSLLESAPDPLLIMNGQGRVTLVNARAEQLFGYTHAEMLGKSIDALLYQAGVKRDLDNSVAVGHTSSGSPPGEAPELRASRKDGSWAPVELSFSPLQTKEGLLTISIIRDITERKKVERLRAARHAVRRILVEGTSLAGVTPLLLEVLCESLRLDLSVLWTVSTQAGALGYVHGHSYLPGTGQAFQEASQHVTYRQSVGLPGRAWADCRPVWSADPAAAENSPRSSAAADQGLREAFAFPILFGTEVLGVIECFRREPEGADAALVDTLQVIGSQVGHFLKHRQAEDAVRASEARKAAILESAVDAIITLDHEGRVLELNPAAERIFGHTQAASAGRELAGLLVPPDSRPAYDRILADCRRHDGAATRGERTELVLTRADGTAVPVELAVTGIRTEGPPLFTCYIRDLTERHRGEEALRQAEESLRQATKMEAVGQLAGGVAHDFNNILTVISGYSELLLNMLPEDSVHRGHVQIISSSAQRAASLTRQLLAFSRKQMMVTRVFDLNTTVADMDKMLQRLIGEHIDLITIPSRDLRLLKADPGQIEQVIMNLAVNARDAMPEGGKLTIETRNVEINEAYTYTHPEVRPGRYVLLAISDTGIGMDQATRERIFEPFFTTKEVGKGTGLGLAMVYGIVKQSGGHIAVYSEPGQGTTFKIYLPSTDEKLPLAPGPHSAALLPKGKGTILLVEDEEMVRTLSSQILRQNGYTVREARHGLDALRLSEAELDSIDLTVTDVVMPEMSGHALAQRLLVRKPDMKVLYMSGYTDNAVMRSGLLEPGSAFLEKPFSLDSLTRKIHDLMSV